jgi:hypothetical protein
MELMAEHWLITSHPLKCLEPGGVLMIANSTYTLGVLEVCLYKLSLTQYDLWLSMA